MAKKTTKKEEKKDIQDENQKNIDIYPKYLGLLTFILIAIMVGAGIIGFYQYKVIPDLEVNSGPKILGVKSEEPKKIQTQDLLAWETYMNSKYEYLLKYPKDWYIYDKGWLKSDKTYSDPQKTVFISEKPFKQDFKEGSDIEIFTFTIDIQEKLPPKTIEDSLKNEATVTLEKIGGIEVIKAVSNKIGSQGKIFLTSYYINRKGYTYIISWPNEDSKGTHNEIYDQIFSTFNFEK